MTVRTGTVFGMALPNMARVAAANLENVGP